jgi:hypothetical protein
MRLGGQLDEAAAGRDHLGHARLQRTEVDAVGVVAQAAKVSPSGSTPKPSP